MGMADDETFTINGESTTLDNYKLPKVIDVSVTLTLIESKSSTQHGYLYGFDKFPKVPKVSSETTGKSAEVVSDANTKNSVSQTEATINTSVGKVDTVNASAKINNPAETKTTSAAIGTDAKTVEQAKGGTKIEEGAKPKTPPPADDPVKGKFAKTYVTQNSSVLFIYTTPAPEKYPGQWIATSYLKGQKVLSGNRQSTQEAAVTNLEKDWLSGI
jgi:hypothetical protein